MSQDIVKIKIPGKLPHYEAQDGIFRVKPGNMLSRRTGGKRLEYRVKGDQWDPLPFILNTPPNIDCYGQGKIAIEKKDMRQVAGGVELAINLALIRGCGNCIGADKCPVANASLRTVENPAILAKDI